MSPRSLARALSAIKSFYRWMGQTYGVSTTAVLSTRTPKFEKPLPRPVKKSDAKDLIKQIDLQSEHEWINAEKNDLDFVYCNYLLDKKKNVQEFSNDKKRLFYLLLDLSLR